jgi:hypothetical protein
MGRTVLTGEAHYNFSAGRNQASRSGDLFPGYARADDLKFQPYGGG